MVIQVNGSRSTEQLEMNSWEEMIEQMDQFEINRDDRWYKLDVNLYLNYRRCATFQ